MLLPPLLKFVYNHGSEEIIRRGKIIYKTAGVSILEQDTSLRQIKLRVRNDAYANHYTVTVNNVENIDKIKVRCQCPYNVHMLCRHSVAGLMYLNEALSKGLLNTGQDTYDQNQTTLSVKTFNEVNLRLLAGEEAYNLWNKIAHKIKVNIVEQAKGKIVAEVTYPSEHKHRVGIHINAHGTYDTSCPCDHSSHVMCKHKLALACYVRDQKLFESIFSSSKEELIKSTLLAQYGYRLTDDLTGKFMFVMQDGRPTLRVLDPSIKKISQQHHEKAEAKPIANAAEFSVKPATVDIDIVKIQINSQPLFPIELVLMQSGGQKSDSWSTSYKELKDNAKITVAHEWQNGLLNAWRKLTEAEFVKYLKRVVSFGELYDNLNALKEILGEDTYWKEWELYLIPKLVEFLKRYYAQLSIYVQNDQKKSSPFLANVADHSIRLILKIRKEKNKYSLELLYEQGVEQKPFKDLEFIHPFLYLDGKSLQYLETAADLELAKSVLSIENKSYSKKEWVEVIIPQIKEWIGKIKFDIDYEVKSAKKQIKPQLAVLMEESEYYLELTPFFKYGELTMPIKRAGDFVYIENDELRIAKRNIEEENRLLEWFTERHTSFYIGEKVKQKIPWEKALEKNWLLRFAKQADEAGVLLLGQEQLTRFKPSKAAMTYNFNVSSQVDWFDVNVDVKFGEEMVSMRQIRDAILKDQQFVKLKDGTVGVLNQAFLDKYRLLFKVAYLNDNTLKLKKIHFNVLDNSGEDISTEVKQELEQKKQQLLEVIKYDNIDDMIPEGLSTVLRPYQIAGLNWFKFLEQSGWGGILADDMGLGKTIQTLSFFMYYKNKYPDAQFLVVCPTSLLFNWENEILKFVPKLKYHVHHGTNRLAKFNRLKDIDIYITSYGTMRSDINMLKDKSFDYIVLDESQSIKNPNSLVTKAANQLVAKNRIALSGTPLQNNTFDLYAQMHFLNQGMLGSRDAFSQKFAQPIDKFQDDAAKKELYQLVFPFILRRTKEQVAKDLPAKTETILYCEMGAEQKAIYNQYRDKYRSEILANIDNKGIDQSKMMILQGLMRLRQICNAPSIVKMPEPMPEVSIKADELIREVSENIGNHKVLIFSQFIGMLELLRKRLTDEGIKCAYFDGSSTKTEREQNIKAFREQEDVRVFLISLKAGGLGLNLVEADYVYIVDPWWNPAVEQQAIDRAHRIGQTRSVFAYRMICKDTIEEKIIELQKKKMDLANALVTDDSSIIKRLTKEDIQYILS